MISDFEINDLFWDTMIVYREVLLYFENLNNMELFEKISGKYYEQQQNTADIKCRFPNWKWLYFMV